METATATPGELNMVGGPEETTLADVYRRDYGRLVRLSFSILGRRADAEELVHDSFVTAQRNWTKVGAYEDPGAWLRHVLVNACISHQRRAGSEARALALVGSSAERDELGVDVTEPDEALWRAVRNLPRMQAAVIGLMFVDDRSAAETAVILGCAEDTVRTHLRRAKTTLATQLRIPSEEDLS